MEKSPSALLSQCKHYLELNTEGSIHSLLAKLQATCAGNAGPCTNVWVAGSLAVRCKTCQTSNTSAICIDCFKAGDHYGHDFSIYASPAGGACDCGDPLSFVIEGCCPRHRPAPAGASPQALPPSLPSLISSQEVQALSLSLSVVLTHFTLAAVACASADPAYKSPAAEHDLVQLSRWLHDFVALTPVRPLACQLVMKDLGSEIYHVGKDGVGVKGRGRSESVQQLCHELQQQQQQQQLTEGFEAIRDEGQDVSGGEKAALCRSLEHSLEDALAEMQGLLLVEAQKLSSNTHKSLLSVLLRQLGGISSKHKEAIVEVTTFLLLLLYDADCKYYTAVHLLACYPDLLNTILAGNQVYHPLTTALDRLTVQLFNSEDVTFRLVQESSLLQTLIDMLHWVTSRVLTLLLTPPAGESDVDTLLAESKVLWHCHRRVQGDLNMVLHHGKVAAAFVLLPGVHAKFLSCLAQAQLMMQHTRRTHGDMVPMPSFKVECALNMEVVLLSLVPELEGVLRSRAKEGNEAGAQQVHLLQLAASSALEATYNWGTSSTSSISSALSSSTHPNSSPHGAAFDDSSSTQRQHTSSWLTSVQQIVSGHLLLLAGPSTGPSVGSCRDDSSDANIMTRRKVVPQNGKPELPHSKFFWEHLASGTLPVSPHLPLHRTFAALFSALIGCEHSESIHVSASASSALHGLLMLLRLPAPQVPPAIAAEETNVWQHIQRHVLLLQCFFIQTRLRLWILNGDDIAMLEAFYQGFHELRDLDVLLMQICLAAGPPHAALIELLYGLGARPLLHSAGVPQTPPNEPTAQYLAVKRRLRGCECALQLLLVLLRDRISCGSPEARVRQLLLQWLAIKDTGHAQLVQALPTDLQQSCGPTVDKILEELATYRSPSLAASGKYMLKAEAWRSFDPNSSQYTPVSKQKALERAMQAGYQPHWQLNAPGPLPPSLEPMRAVLKTPELYMLIHHILSQMVSTQPAFTSEDLTLSALNLFALQLHYTQELVAQHLQQVSNSSSTSPAVAKDAIALAAAALNGGIHYGTRMFAPGILEMLAKKAGPAATSAGAQQKGEGGGVDEVVDCCCHLLMRSQDVLQAGRAAGLLPELPQAPAPAACAQGADSYTEPPEADLKARAKARQAEAMAKLHAQQAAFVQQAGGGADGVEGDSDAEMETPGGGRHTSQDEDPLDLDRLEEPLGLPSYPEQRQQQQESAGVAPLHGFFGSWTGPAGSSNDGACCVCQQHGTNESPLGWLGHLQTSGTLERSLIDARQWNEDADASCTTSKASNHGSLPCQWAHVVASKGVWAGSSADWAPGLHLLCCGHQMHMQCFEAQRQQSLVLAATGLIMPASLNASIKHRELFCPVCRRLGNVLLPAADFLWHPKRPPPCILTPPTATLTVMQATHVTATEAGRHTEAALHTGQPSQVAAEQHSSPPSPHRLPEANQAPSGNVREEDRLAGAALTHLAPMALKLAEQARLEADLHASSLEGALNRRTTVMEHNLRDNDQIYGTHRQQQQQEAQDKQQLQRPQRSQPDVRMSLLADCSSNDEQMAEAHEPQGASHTGGAQGSPGSAAPWACAARRSTVSEAREALRECSLTRLLWAMLAHNLALWEATHRPVAAAPVFDMSINQSSSRRSVSLLMSMQHTGAHRRRSSNLTEVAGSSHTSPNAAPIEHHGSQQQPAKCSSYNVGPNKQGGAAEAVRLPVVDTAHWRATRGLAGLCMALGCAHEQDFLTESGHFEGGRNDSSDGDRGSSKARAELSAALCWLLGGDLSSNCSVVGTSSQPASHVLPTVKPCVGIAAGLLPRYDTSTTIATLHQHRAENADAWNSSGTAPAILHSRQAHTWQHLIPDPTLLLLELLAVSSSALGGWDPEAPGAMSDADSSPAATAGTVPASTPTGTPAMPAITTRPQAPTAEAYLSNRASSGHGLLSGLVDLLLPFCALQGAAWIDLASQGRSRSSQGHLAASLAGLFHSWHSSTNAGYTPFAPAAAPVVADQLATGEVDAALLDGVATQVLPFLVRAYSLHCALRPHCPPDANLLQAYTLLQPGTSTERGTHHQRQPGARDLVDRLCLAMRLTGGLQHALSRALAAVTLQMHGNTACADHALLQRWCGHVPWAFAASQAPGPHQSIAACATSTVPSTVPAVSCCTAQLHAVSSQDTAPTHLVVPLPAPPSLIPLPPLFQDLLLFFAEKVCAHCKQVPEHPCLCLASGQLLCSWWTGCGKGRGGGMLHAMEACAGTTLLLSLKSTKVVALRGPRVIVVTTTIYLDAHGEEDPELRRGRPLYCQRGIYEHLSRLYSSSSLDFDSVLLHSSRSNFDWL